MKSFQSFHCIHSDMSADLHPAGESEHQSLPVYTVYHYHLNFFPSNTMGNLNLHELRENRSITVNIPVILKGHCQYDFAIDMILARPHQSWIV